MSKEGQCREKKKLVLHIGTGKAGSTSIQKFLKLLPNKASDVDTLEAFGRPDAAKLVMSCQSPRARAYFVDRKKVVSAAEYEEICSSVFKKAELELSCKATNVFVASSEHFYSLLGHEQILYLKDRLSSLFENIQIVVYLRDQRSFLRSLWGQSISGATRSTIRFDEFLDSIDSQRHFWDYSLFLHQWRQVFGARHVDVNVFDPLAFKGGNLIEDFVSKLDAGRISYDYNSFEEKNRSPSWQDLEAIRQQNIEFHAISEDSLYDEHRSFSTDEAGFDEIILEKVSSGNLWVNREFLSGSKIKLPT